MEIWKRFDVAGILFRHPYWSRLWIVQEQVLARQAVIWFGGYEILPKTLLQYPSLFKRERGSRAEQVLLAADNNGAYSWAASPALFGDLVSGFAVQECQDPRDKVYGLLSLCDTEIEVDYTKSVEQVFIDAIIELDAPSSRLAEHVHDPDAGECAACRTCIHRVLNLAVAMLPERCSELEVRGSARASKQVTRFMRQHPELGLCSSVVDGSVGRTVVDVMCAFLRIKL